MAVYVLGGVSLLAGTMGNAGNLKTYAAERTEIRLDSQETYYSYHGLKKYGKYSAGFEDLSRYPGSQGAWRKQPERGMEYPGNI